MNVWTLGRETRISAALLGLWWVCLRLRWNGKLSIFSHSQIWHRIGNFRGLRVLISPRSEQHLRREKMVLGRIVGWLIVFRRCPFLVSNRGHHFRWRNMWRRMGSPISTWPRFFSLSLFGDASFLRLALGCTSNGDDSAAIALRWKLNQLISFGY